MKKLSILLLAAAAFIPMKANELIEIPTENTEIIFQVNDAGELLHSYYGRKFENTRHLLNEVRNEQPDNGTGYGHQAYPAYGGFLHIRPALKLVHSNGVHSTKLKYQTHSTALVEPGVIRTYIILLDSVHQVDVILHLTAYDKEDVITESVTLTNNGKGELTVENIASSYLPIHADSYYLTHLFGSWATEAQLAEERLMPGIKTISSIRGVQSTQSANPSFMVSVNDKASEDSGEVIAGSLAWAGNFNISFEIDECGTLHIVPGVNDFASTYYLAPGESLTTPEMIWTWSGEGKGLASRNLHDWVRNHNMMHADMERPVVLNSWEGAYFDFDEKVIKRMIDDAAEIGVEMFVLDDGWFGNGEYARNSDSCGLGDWQVNRKKLPRGIDDLASYAVKKGLRFGIWIEPEMVNPKSRLAETHPEWIVGNADTEPLVLRKQRVLDMSNPEVQDFVVNTFREVLAQSPNISYVKWDANRFITDFGSSYLDGKHQSHFWIDYVKGLYSVYDRIRTEYPDVMIQLCSSGGGRMDMGALKYHDEFWPSDNTNPSERILIQNSVNHFFPAMATASHVSCSPNHQSGATSPLKYRFDVAMSGRLGLELQPASLSPEEREQAKRAISEYKQIRPIITSGDLYRLKDPNSDTGRAALQYVTKDASKAALYIYNLKHHGRTTSMNIRLKGLDPSRTYRLTEFNSSFSTRVPELTSVPTSCELSGDFLMTRGIDFFRNGTFDSLVLLLEQVR